MSNSSHETNYLHVMTCAKSGKNTWPCSRH